MILLLKKLPPTAILKIRLKSLVFQIWLSFLALSFILGLWLFLFLKTQDKTELLAHFSSEVTRIHNDFSENIINYQNFILSGYKEVDFYTKDTQPDINNYLKNLTAIHSRLLNLEQNSEEYNLGTNSEFRLLIRNNNQLIQLADSLKTLIKYRGFKDYGVEGRMRKSAHALEDSSYIFGAEILQLRRHEKDFLLRGEEQYELKFNSLLDSLKRRYLGKKKIQALLNQYSGSFKEYVAMSNILGINSENGLLVEIKSVHLKINGIFSGMEEKSAARILELNNQHFNYLITQTIFIAIIAIFVSLFLAKTLTHDIKLLNENFKYYISSDFLKNPDKEISKPDFKPSSTDIKNLFTNFQLLKETLNKTVLRLNKEVEKSEKAANYKTRFLANMSHEIRTPLNGILGMLQLIGIEKLSTEQQKSLEVAEYSANHLLDVVNMILDYSKLEVGKMSVDKRPIDLRLILKNLEGIFHYQAMEKNLEFVVECAEEVPCVINADSMRIQQVLLNLLSNALKFTHHGSVLLKVSKDSETENEIILNFEVIDTGVGINKKDTSKLFEAFEQQDISTTRKHGGTGLGLTITNQLIELMGGQLLLDSQINKGSKFYFSLSFEKVSKSVKQSTSIGNFQKKPSPLGDYKVLVAEDNKINQLVIVKMLNILGINSVLAKDGKEAYELFLLEDFDLVLMDIHMPKLNGLEATNMIKAHSKYAISKPPIIAITASAFEEDRDEALSKGMDDFITKPVLFKVLVYTMKKYLPNLVTANTSF